MKRDSLCEELKEYNRNRVDQLINSTYIMKYAKLKNIERSAREWKYGST